jgi:hypothetical protein
MVNLGIRLNKWLGAPSHACRFVRNHWRDIRFVDTITHHHTPSMSSTSKFFRKSAVLAILFSVVLGACRQGAHLGVPVRGEGDVTQASALVGNSNVPYELREGDIYFQSLPHNPLIDAIEGSSDSPFSHCGILHQHDDAWVVIQAIGPVRETVLASYIAQGRDQRYAVFRLKEPYRAQIPALIEAAQKYEGRPYDIHYDLDDAAIYCSELIYKAFHTTTGEEMGRLQKLGDLRWQPHVEIIKQIEGGNVPLERKMITPRSLSEAEQLVKVFSNYLDDVAGARDSQPLKGG